MKIASRNSARFVDQPTRVYGDIVRGLKVKCDQEAVRAALERHIDAAPFLHAGMVNEDCPACREMQKRLRG